VPSIDRGAHQECSVCNPCKASRYSWTADVLEDKPVLKFLLHRKCNIKEGDNPRRIKSRGNKYDLWLGEVHTKATLTKERQLIPAQARLSDLIEACHRQSGHYKIRRIENLLSR